MAQHPAWEKLTLLIDEVSGSTDLQKVFQTGTQAERLKELMERRWTLEDLHVLSEGARTIAGAGAALGPGWWMW